MEREKSSGSVVFHANGGIEFLLLHYGKGHWGFPKGHIEESESEQEAMLRELEEETGISNARILPGFREEIFYYFHGKSGLIHKNVVFFLTESKTREVRLSREHSGYEWLSAEKARERLSFENTKKILGKAAAFLEKARE